MQAMPLTEEQREQIETQREAALERKRRRLNDEPKTGPDSPGDMSLEEMINAAPIGQVVEFNLRVREDSDDAGSQQDQPDEGKSKACPEPQPRKRPRWKTGVLKTCNRCADFEAFISLLMPLLTKPLRWDPGVRALNCD